MNQHKSIARRLLPLAVAALFCSLFFTLIQCQITIGSKQQELAAVREQLMATAPDWLPGLFPQARLSPMEDPFFYGFRDCNLRTIKNKIIPALLNGGEWKIADCEKCD